VRGRLTVALPPDHGTFTALALGQQMVLSPGPAFALMQRLGIGHTIAPSALAFIVLQTAPRYKRETQSLPH
jgi:hypothetical protein